MKCTFADIYSLNREPNKFLKNILKKLRVFKAGDLNSCLDSHSQNEIKKLLDYQLVDI